MEYGFGLLEQPPFSNGSLNLSIHSQRESSKCNVLSAGNSRYQLFEEGMEEGWGLPCVVVCRVGATCVEHWVPEEELAEETDAQYTVGPYFPTRPRAGPDNNSGIA